MLLFLDTETFCETNLKTAGLHRYAEDVEVMIVSWAVDEGPVRVWDRTDGSPMPPELRFALDEADTIVCHKSDFDRTVLRFGMDIVIEPERMHDTMVQARCHGLPGALGKLSDIFSLGDKSKDKAGHQLVMLFCKPRPVNSKIRRATRQTHPIEWQRFLDYAGLDIVSMRELYFRKLPRWNYPDNPREFALWCQNERMNDRGFKVDLDLARGAIAAVDAEKKHKDVATGDLTYGDVTSTTQRDRLLKHLLNEWGVELPDMQSSTLERRLADETLPWPVRELIAIRLQVSTTSNAKYNTLLRAVSSDGRLRGGMVFSGAPRTKRWSGSLFQGQNLPRPDMDPDDIALGIELMRHGHSTRLLYDNVMQLASNAIRGVIVADEGRKLVVSDLEQIEARVLPWLAGAQWKLDAFEAYDRGEGPDLYRIGAARILRRDVEEITKDERQSHGKVPELACGYGGSVGAFHSMAKVYGLEVTDAEATEIVRDWRGINPEIADWDDGFWAQLDRAARMAIGTPGRVFMAGEKIGFEKWRNWLKMHLPSGGFLSYADPRIVPDPRWAGKDTIGFMGINNYTKRWERLYTYGGKLSADATQSTAREIMAWNLPAIEDAGYLPVLTVHDEVLTETPDDPAFTHAKLSGLLSACPPWAKGLPISASGFEDVRYRKDG